MSKHIATAAILLMVAAAAHAGASEELRLRKEDDFKCNWLQAYVDVRIDSCLRSNDEMVVVPASRLTRAAAVELMAISAVAAEMQKRSPQTLSVALTPDLKSFIRVTGSPVRFDGTADRKAAIRSLSKAAVDCKIKNWDTVCSDGTLNKLKPVH